MTASILKMLGLSAKVKEDNSSFSSSVLHSVCVCVCVCVNTCVRAQAHICMCICICSQ